MDITPIPRSVGLPEKEGRAEEMFAGTGISITIEGRKHLGAALGSRSYLEQYVGGKVADWVGEVTRLATFGWTYFMRTLPDLENLLQPLERAISDVLIPSLIGDRARSSSITGAYRKSWAHKSTY